MKSDKLIYLILLCTGLSLLMSCTGKKKDDPKPIDSVIYLYKLNYDTTYYVSNTGQGTGGTANTIDSNISVTFGASDSLFINNSGFAYNSQMDLYFNEARTTVSFSGTDKSSIAITYVNGIGNRSYHVYFGTKQ
ncbi:MAG: hypothetical protein JNM21_09705 [Taibaiella sp.]|nr:hypothetical protein [Taibaiella sp.]